MVPGMGNCGGRPVPATFDALSALDAWVSHDLAPDRIMASHMKNGVADYTRPLCAFLQVARPKGPGGTDKAEGFCVLFRRYCHEEAAPVIYGAFRSPSLIGVNL